MHFLLLYDYVPDIAERRAPHRQLHLRHAWAAQARGELLLAGALAEPLDGAVFLFSIGSDEPIRRFAIEDPYVIAGLVTRWRVRPWTTVVGDQATTPLRPEP